MDIWKRRSFLVGAAYYCTVSLAIILFSSPLFHTLGFEYSGIIALLASIHLLYYSAGFSVKRKSDGHLKLIKSISFPVFLLSSIPLVISVFSVIFIPNCSLWDGIVFYIEIVYPTALIAMFCGIYFGISVKSKRALNISLALFWIITLIISLLPGYFSGRIYTYGWQYGYFPGFVWDEAMELQPAYWWSRILELLLIISWILFTRKLKDYTKEDFKRGRHAYSWQFWFMTAVGIWLSTIFVREFSEQAIDHFLRSTFVLSHIRVHYSTASFTSDEITLLQFNLKSYEKEIDSTYRINTLTEIDLYIFPSADDLYDFVGTREASISKPWKHSIYITKANLHSLKHEMAHVMLAQYGNFPFDISWSTGLTEGAAVAIEDDYDGIRSIDEYSAQMLQMKLADGVQKVMQPSGFLNSAPSQSYVIAGSFSKYLIQAYGAEKFLRVYRERDYNRVYNKSLSILDEEWKKLLFQEFEIPMEHYDSLRTTYYFKRSSIFLQPCVRRIGKLLKNADEAFKNKNYNLADSLYEIIVNESGRGRAIQGRVQSLLHQRNFAAALAVLDTTTAAQEIKNKASLYLLRGDVIVLATGDLRKASTEWEEAIKLELGDSYFMRAFMHRYFLGGAKNVEATQKVLGDIYSIDPITDKYDLLYSIEPMDSNDFAFTLSRLYIYSSYLNRTGELSKAYSIWKNGIEKIANMIPDTFVIGLPLFKKLAKEKYLHYEEIFKGTLQSAESTTLP